MIRTLIVFTILIIGLVGGLSTLMQLISDFFIRLTQLSHHNHTDFY